MTDEPATGAPRWRDRQPLSGADLTDFLALRRICGHPHSGVEQVAGQYVEHGRPVLPFIADGISVLLDIGHATLGEPDPVSGTSRPVLVTATGRARYEQLCDQQGIQPYPTALPEPGTEAQWVYADDSFAHLVAHPAVVSPGTLLTRCGRALPAETTPTFSVPPSLALARDACLPGVSSHRRSPSRHQPTIDAIDSARLVRWAESQDCSQFLRPEPE